MVAEVGRRKGPRKSEMGRPRAGDPLWASGRLSTEPELSEVKEAVAEADNFHAHLGCPPPKQCAHSQRLSQALTLDSASSSALHSDTRSPAAVLASVLSLACRWWLGGGVGVGRSPVQERTPKH